MNNDHPIILGGRRKLKSTQRRSFERDFSSPFSRCVGFVRVLPPLLLIFLITFLPVAKAETQLILETEKIEYLPLEIVKIQGTLTYNEEPVRAVLVSLLWKKT